LWARNPVHETRIAGGAQILAEKVRLLNNWTEAATILMNC
jgi:hypothetical protein